MHSKPIPNLTEAEIVRFWSKIAIGTPNECWIWQAAKAAGYGKFGMGGLVYKANRIVAFLTYGPAPPGFIARHTCDNPPCCNPGHVIWDSQQGNIVDQVTKKRHWLQNRPEAIQGEKHPRSVLTDDLVRQIRRMSGTAKAVAEQLGIKKGNVHDVRQGKVWKHVTDEIEKPE